jgi:signal transduction histidine kinase
MSSDTKKHAEDRLGFRVVGVEPDAEEVDLKQLLTAWDSATERLRHTHEALRDEVRRLTHELEVKNRELARKNRLTDLGQMASHIAHEVRNGLTPLTLYLSLLRRRCENNPEIGNLIDKIDAGFTAMDATVHDLLHFASDREPAWQSFGMGELLGEVLDPLRPQFDAQGIQVSVDVPGALRAMADRNMVRRALLNLILNAIDAMPGGGELVVTGCETRDGWELEVADSGPGLPAGLQSQIFEPFVTTKSCGTGLGLAVVYRVAEVHGGSVTAMNCPEGGAAFVLRIPTRRALEAAA